jgi:hypothetical protein
MPLGNAPQWGKPYRRVYLYERKALVKNAMLLLAIAAAVAAQTPRTATAPALAPVVVQATATVRILSGVRLKLDSPTNAGAPAAHDSTVTTDGAQHPARLIEFQ